eukprot:765703-Alexandrium_andersonii.AAC.1
MELGDRSTMDATREAPEVPSAPRSEVEVPGSCFASSGVPHEGYAVKCAKKGTPALFGERSFKQGSLWPMKWCKDCRIQHGATAWICAECLLLVPQCKCL